MPDPIVILQMQRMGDLVLTWPLLLWLSRRFKGHPLLVAAEPMFFNELLPLSPDARYLPWDKAAKVKGEHFRMVVNLSHRPEAAHLAGELDCATRIGPVRTDQGLYIHGPWQLYRASLVHNNRHNRFHWADLNGLDAVPLARISSTRWPEPKVPAKDNNRVGLFLGASQEEKRPPQEFWVELARQLIKRGLHPLLLGGPAEADLGKRVAKSLGRNYLNLCGKFSVAELARALSTLALMVTPDTGPMHLAAWVGIKTLNLSMGPVSPWETAPYQGGHYVLQADMSCVGCWRCTNVAPYACRERFSVKRVAGLVQRMFSARNPDLSRMQLPGLRLFQTGRDPDGLYSLAPVDGARQPGARELVARFWRSFFGAHLGLWSMERAHREFSGLAQEHPALRMVLRKSLARLAKDLSALRARNDQGVPGLDQEFWTKHAPLMRPLTGYLHLSLQNADFSATGFRESLALVESLLGSTG